MQVKKLKIPGICLISEDVNHDSINGYRQNTYSWTAFRLAGIPNTFIYESEVRLKEKNTLKGMYFQEERNKETILIRCLTGKVLIKVIDVRPESATYRKVVSVELSAEKCQYLLIPYGFAHGFLSLEENTCLQYKSDQMYFAKCTKVLNCFDPRLGLVWPEEEYILSAADRYALGISDLESEYFKILAEDKEIAVSDEE